MFEYIGDIVLLVVICLGIYYSLGEELFYD